MNRREFIRTAIATTTLVAVAATGFFEIAAKAAANQASLQQQANQVQLPQIASLTGQSSTQASQGVSSGRATSQSSAAQATSTVEQSSSAQGSATAPAGYVLVALVSSLSGKTSAYFTHPLHGSSILLSIDGQWRAFSAICTHRVCTLEFTSSELYCPCHGATFSATDGSVTRGPAQVTLGEYGVTIQGGSVYVSDAVIN